MRKYFVLFLFMWNHPANSQENDWIIIVTSTAGTTWSIRSSDIINVSNYNPRVWVEADSKKDKTVKWRSWKAYFQLDCKNRMYQQLSGFYYDANGKVDHSFYERQNSYSFEYSAPGTMTDVLLDFACPTEKN